MLYWWAILFFLIALVVIAIGFWGAAASIAGIAKILFGVFLVLAILSLLFGRKAPG